MSDEVVEELIRGWTFGVATRIKLPNAFDLNTYKSVQDMVTAIYNQDPGIGAALTNTIAAYEHWWSFIKKSYAAPLNPQEREQLAKAIVNRDKSRETLAELLKDHQ